MSNQKIQNNPAWLLAPPSGVFPKEPVSTRVQALPYQELSWENFERLINRLVRFEADISECWVYGTPGQKQYGLDILAEAKDGNGVFKCYQCKKVLNFSADDIQKAVDTFLAGKWVSKTKEFILCTSSTLSKTDQVEEIAAQRNRLKKLNIGFNTWDGSEAGSLSEKLKNHPDLVDDFFSREWVRQFNGESALQSLGERLDGLNLSKLRSKLYRIYEMLFDRYDQGIRLPSKVVMPLFDRYVKPNVIQTKDINMIYEIPEDSMNQREDDEHIEKDGLHEFTSSNRSQKQEIKLRMDDWITRNNRSVILGEPGYGKSVFLRIITLQLLKELDSPFNLPWHELLPVWISFGGFCSEIKRNDSVSLEDYFVKWLHLYSADEIIPLFRTAIKSEGILILIDGLDECQDPQLAQQAMSRLSAFLSINTCPAIFTCRPKGHLHAQPDGTWPSAQISPFSEEQIESFSLKWLQFIELNKGECRAREEWIDLNAEQCKDEFLKAVRVNPRVFDLAKTPLFCQLLIDVFRFSHHLPEKRIKVYDKIIELLLNDHPSSRAQAAGLGDSQNTPQIDDLKYMLTELALQIQKQGTGMLRIERCEEIFCEFLQDDFDGPGLSRYQAKHQAKVIIEFAQTGLGLIVERAPEQIGFFHLTVQEYLSAKAMVRREETEQFEWLFNVWTQPSWHEVVIAWFSVMGSEYNKRIVQRAIDALKEHASTPILKIKLLLLRTELAVGEHGLSPREARATVNEAASEIEISPFNEVKRSLSRFLALGLRIATVKDECFKRISNWGPSRSEWKRAALIRDFASWTPSEELLNTLKIILHDESHICRWAAAETLANLYNNVPEIKKYLYNLALFWPDTDVRASALHAFHLGWPEAQELPELSDEACKSNDQNLVLVGISLKVGIGTHDDSDRELVWQMATSEFYSWRIEEILFKVLIKGWGTDLDIKKRAIDYLDKKQNRRLRNEKIIQFLATTWRQDKDVANCISKFFERSHSDISTRDVATMNSLKIGFKGNRRLIAIIKEKLSQDGSLYSKGLWGPQLSATFCIFGDEESKKEAIQAFKSQENARDKYWITHTLMDAWPEDEEIKTILKYEFKSKPPGELGYLSDWIELFEPDENKRREWLLNSVKTTIPNSIWTAAERLIVDYHDEECLDAVIQMLNQKDIWYYRKMDIIGLLFIHYWGSPKLTHWVEEAFTECDGPSFAIIAEGAQGDPDSCKRLMKTVRPASHVVRAEIFNTLLNYSIPIETISKLTDEIWAEDDSEIRTLGIRARCYATMFDPNKRKKVVEKLTEESKAIGTKMDTRRRSAAAGLLQLEEYDLFFNAFEEDSHRSLDRLISYWDRDNAFIEILMKHWETLTDIADSRNKKLKIPWDHLIHSGYAREMLSNSDRTEQFLRFIKESETKPHSQVPYHLVADILPESEILKKLYLKRLNQFSGTNYDFETIRSYALTFGGNEDSLHQLKQALGKGSPPYEKNQLEEAFIYALAIGWPEDDSLKPHIDPKNKYKHFLMVAIALAGITGNETVVKKVLDNMISRALQSKHYISEIELLSLKDWASKPKSESLLISLCNHENPIFMINGSFLLNSINKIDEGQRNFLSQIFDKNMTHKNGACPDGIDLFNKKTKTIPQAIINYLL